MPNIRPAVAVLLAVLALSACGPQHSQDWQTGYYAGKAANQQAGGTGDENSCSVVMSVYFHNQSADWQDGFMTGCTGGSP